MAHQAPKFCHCLFSLIGLFNIMIPASFYKFYQDIVRCRVALQNEQPQSILWQPAIKCKSWPPMFSNYSLLDQKLL